MDDYIMLRTDQQTKQRIEALARENDRSMSAQIRWLINQEYDRTHYQPEADLEREVERRR